MLRGGLTIDTPVAVSLLVPGDVLSATVADADGVRTVDQVEWRRDGKIVSASPDYAVEASDFGEPLNVSVTYTDNMGHSETVLATVFAFRNPVGAIRRPARAVDDGAEGWRRLLSARVASTGGPAL